MLFEVPFSDARFTAVLPTASLRKNLASSGGVVKFPVRHRLTLNFSAQEKLHSVCCGTPSLPLFPGRLVPTARS